MRSFLIYVAGPYTAARDKDMNENVSRACDVAADLWALGYTPVIPHVNFNHLRHTADYSDIMEACLAILQRCDGIYMMPGWRDSQGATTEYDFANDRMKIVFLQMSDVVAHRKASEREVHGP